MTYKIINILSVTAPICAMILGVICWRFPPKGPTCEVGFRSRRARAGEKSWVFAQQLAGKLWFFLGLILLVAAILVIGKIRQAPAEEALRSFLHLLAVQILCLIGVTVLVNGVLLYRFDRFGRDRTQVQKRADVTTSPEQQVPDLTEEMEEPTWIEPEPEQWEEDMTELGTDDLFSVPECDEQDCDRTQY